MNRFLCALAVTPWCDKEIPMAACRAAAFAWLRKSDEKRD
jgi:hypothetical protein